MIFSCAEYLIIHYKRYKHAERLMNGAIVRPNSNNMKIADPNPVWNVRKCRRA